MTKYCIGYDLHDPEKNYPKITAAIESYSSAHVLGSQWFIKSNKSTREIAEHLVKFIDLNDVLVVSLVKGTVEHTNSLNQEAANWLENN